VTSPPGRLSRVMPAARLLRQRPVILATAVVILLAVARVAIGGWDSMSADHARYVFSGMSLLDGRGYVSEAGGTFYVRAPAYPLMIGGAYAVAGANGAHVLVWCLGVGGMLLAVALAARLGGSLAAWVTTGAIATGATFWEQIASLGIDLPHAAFLFAAVVLLGQPTPARWLAAGVVLGVTVLIKETAAPAVFLLPLAWLPAWSDLSWGRWVRLGLLLLIAVVVVAAWWWVLVWRETGLLFPLNSLRAIVPAEDVLDASPQRTLQIAWIAAAPLWAYLLLTRFRDVGVRLLAFGALALAPAVIATVALTQPERNLTALLLLSCVAAGVAVADLYRATSQRASPRVQRAVAVALVIALVAGAAVGQSLAARAFQDPLFAETAARLRKGLEPGQAVITTFRSRSPLGVELFSEHVTIELVPVVAVARPADPADYLWLGLRRGTLFGVRRDHWQRTLGSKNAVYLVLVAPHALSPVELVPALRTPDGRNAGVTFLEQVQGPSGKADIFDIDPDRVDQATAIHVHAKAGALVRWLDIVEATGATDAEEKLLAARPVVPRRGTELNVLARRLGDAACFRPQREDGTPVLVIEPSDQQNDCLSDSVIDRLS
jgi:hypothetical protein